jgi:hypothetical protein
MNEARGLDAPQTGRGEPRAQLGPHRRLEGYLVVLETVPRPHVTHAHKHMWIVPHTHRLPSSDAACLTDTLKWTFASS